MNKKLVALCMVSTVVMSMLSGCGEKPNKEASNTQTSQGDTAQTDDSAVKDVTISILHADKATAPYSKDWEMLKLVKEKTGATLDIQPVPSSDFATKRKIVFNSGSMPDIISHTYPEAADAMNGLLLPISDYEDKLPNFMKYIKDNGFQEELDNTRFADGKYYGLPADAHTTKMQPQQWIIRKDIFEKNNIPVPTTLEEIYEAGVKLKEIYPDSTPITNRFGSANLMAGIAAGYGTIAGWTIGDGANYDKESKEWYFAPTTDEWKKMLEYTNKLYESGVLDQEYTSIESPVYESKIVSGDTFILYDWSQNITRYEPLGKAEDAEFELAIINPPTGPNGDYALKWAAPWNDSTVLPASLKDDPEHLDAVLKFIDWCYTDEAETLMTFGQEGKQYEVKDGVLKFIDTDAALAEGFAQPALALRGHKDIIIGEFSEENRKVFEESGKYVPMPRPTSPLSVEQLDATQVYATTLTDYVNMMMEKYIAGIEPLSTWDSFVKECENKGAKKLIDEYNKSAK